MVEVFKTNVADRSQADLIRDRIHSNYPGILVNFDLDDCDNILRVKSQGEGIDLPIIINLLQGHGYWAEVLPDDQPSRLRQQFITLRDQEIDKS